MELETRVLAAALRQSIECGDMEGSSLAHEQIFILLRACQEMAGIASGGAQEPAIDSPNERPVGLIPAEPVSEITDAVKGLATLGDTMASDFKPDLPEGGSIESSTINEKPSLSEAHQVDLPRTGGSDSAGGDFYAVLGIGSAAESRDIHLCFLIKARSILRFIKDRSEPLRGAERQSTLRKLQSIWIAHDVLLDPATRKDYDQRLAGVFDTAGSAESESTLVPEKNLRIGELLQGSGLLEKTELEIAADMHKAMPELMIVAFLVKQGFIQEEDLECVHLAQQLIKCADI